MGGRFESCGRDAVPEVRLSENREPISASFRFCDQNSKLSFVSHGQESQEIRIPKPLPADFGMFECELNSCVNALAALDTRVQICTGHNVELVS